jgi:hypothetical protein
LTLGLRLACGERLAFAASVSLQLHPHVAQHFSRSLSRNVALDFGEQVRQQLAATLA